MSQLAGIRAKSPEPRPRGEHGNSCALHYERQLGKRRVQSVVEAEKTDPHTEQQPSDRGCQEGDANQCGNEPPCGGDGRGDHKSRDRRIKPARANPSSNRGQPKEAPLSPESSGVVQISTSRGFGVRRISVGTVSLVVTREGMKRMFLA